MSTPAYPVHVDAQLDPQLSRGLWLVKWLLAIPHYIVLAFLWLAFAVTSVVAFFGILFTGRYPRAIFDFNVGVLRWSWRVAYYAYGALGTDRYPPFTLHDVPDYPAHLEVDYPEHLSRGLVLVKWWLLAIPHYIVVGLFLSGVYYAASADDAPALWGSGLIGILVLIAGVGLLFTGRYPQPLFDFVLGLNRWVLRVAGYVGLMTDRYPPFALEQGGHEQGSAATAVLTPPAPGTAPTGTAPGTPPPPSGAPPVRRTGWTTGRVVSLVLGSVMALVALGAGISGAALAVADATARDDAGFLMSGSQALSTPTYAVTSTNLSLHVDAPAAFMPDAIFGDAKVTATSTNGNDVFIGIGPTADVRAYLAGVGHATLTELRDGQPSYTITGGPGPAAPPGDQTFWTAQDSGAGTRSITTPIDNGSWTVVLMNADGTPAVAADAKVGAEVPSLPWIVGTLLVVAAVALLLALVLVVAPLRGVSRDHRSAAGTPASTPPATPPAAGAPPTTGPPAP